MMNATSRFVEANRCLCRAISSGSSFFAYGIVTSMYESPSTLNTILSVGLHKHQRTGKPA